MGTTEIAISKANSIRFSDRESDDPFEALLSCEESYSNKIAGKYDQTFFTGDAILVQVKAGLTATVVMRKYTNENTYTTLTADNTETYTTAGFIIYEYLLNVTVERFYLTATSEVSSHRSEWVNCVVADSTMMLLQWTNLDDSSDTFEFDYLTTLAIANVNFMRLYGQQIGYKPGGEITVYDNQNEKSKIKGSVSRKLTFVSEKIPRQVAEIITIATQHDKFLSDSAGYITEDLPEIEMMGGFCQLTTDLTLGLSLGMNTHDIGFDCDLITNNMIENKYQEDATGTGTFAVSDGYGITQIIAKVTAGTPILKIGTTVGSENIFRTETLTHSIPPLIDNNRYTPDIEGAWTIYYEVTGGTADLFLQTIKFNPTS